MYGVGIRYPTSVPRSLYEYKHTDPGEWRCTEDRSETGTHTAKSWLIRMTSELLPLRWITYFLLLSTAQCTSFLVVTTGKAVCKSAELAKDTFVKILFEAPDLNNGGNGIKPGPVFVSITETPTQSALDLINEEEGVVHRKPERPIPPISHEMKQESGSFVHKVKRDAEVNFCIRASSAGTKNPMRFALRLEELGDEEAAAVKAPPSNSVDAHLTSMEEQLNRIESEMHAVLREADFARERDSVYHIKTDAMHKATTFWPIVHVCILLATGFTQANHIVHFFKKRRII